LPFNKTTPPIFIKLESETIPAVRKAGELEIV